MNIPRRQSNDSDLVVVALCPSPWLRFALSQSVRGALRLERVESAPDAWRALRRTGAGLFIAEARDVNGLLIDGLLADVHRLAPQLAIIVTFGASDATSQDLLVLRALGLTQVVFAGELDSPPLLAAIARDAPLRVRRARIGARVAASLPPEAGWILRYAIEHGDRPMSVPEFAHALGKSEDSIARLLRTGVFLTPREAIAWGRLIAAAIGLEASVCTTAFVANEMEFSSPQGLCNLLKEYVRITPTALRAQGGSEYVLAALSETMNRRR